MPELPEVESVRRQLEPALRGRRVVAVWADAQRRFHAPHRLLGHTVQGVGRRGKFLLCPLDGRLELALAGDEEASSSLLFRTMSAGHRVAAFVPVASDLEELFLQITATEEPAA